MTRRIARRGSERRRQQLARALAEMKTAARRLMFAEERVVEFGALVKLTDREAGGLVKERNAAASRFGAAGVRWAKLDL